MAPSDSSVVFLLLKTGRHRQTVDCCRNCLRWASPIVSFSSALFKSKFDSRLEALQQARVIYFYLIKCNNFDLDYFLANQNVHLYQENRSAECSVFFYRATACNAMHGIAKACCLSVCLSVRLTVKCVLCDKMKKLVPTFLYHMKNHLSDFSDKNNGWWEAIPCT